MTMMGEKIFLFGAGGHAKVVLDAARRQGYQVLGLFDDNPKLVGTTLLGCPVIGGRAELAAWCAANGVAAGLVSIGHNAIRGEVAAWLRAEGLRLVSVIHPQATVAESVRLEPGSVVMAGAVINVDTVLGANCIVNTGASVDHDCVIGDNVHIGPGCRLCGNVTVGETALLGAGSTVIPGVTIGEKAVIGAGSTVIRDIPANVTAVGSPCRIVK
jgi:sugar O-acyltransferase (sialic acid O-acetyltransferase NeuD family)